MGFAYLGIGLGGALVPLLSHTLVEHFGWQAALRMLGILITAMAFPLAFLVKEAPVGFRAHERTGLVEARSACRSPSFYLLRLGSMCSIAAVSGTQNDRKLFLSLDRHCAQAAAAHILSLVLAFSIIGRLLMGWLCDCYPKRNVMLLIYLLVAAAIPFLFFGTGQLAVYVFAVVFGIGLGGDYMIIPLMTAEMFGVRILGRLMGVLFDCWRHC